jgi:hypothetical protein
MTRIHHAGAARRAPLALAAAGLLAAAACALPSPAQAAANPLIHEQSAAAYDTPEKVAQGIERGSIAQLYGKDFVDNISLSGNAWVAGTWTATVQYDTALVAADAANGVPATLVPGKSTTGSTTDGVDAQFGQGGWQTYDSATGTWQATEAGGRANDGKIDLVYTTAAGPWVPQSSLDGDRTADGNDTVAHANGTYQVTIPTAIRYSGMKVGKVETSDDYTINVTGVVGAGQVVKVIAESGKVLDGPTDAGSRIVETTSMKTPNFSVGEGAYVDADGKAATYAASDNFRIVTAAEAANPKPENEAAGAALDYLDDPAYSVR